MFETGPYLRLYYGASGDMHAHGVQGLAGERLWHGISLWQLHSHNSSALSKSSDVRAMQVGAYVGTICMPAEKSTYACVQLGWCIPKLVSILRLQADSQNRVVVCVIMRCACRYIATPVLLDA